MLLWQDESFLVCMQARANDVTRMHEVKMGLLLPHEIFSAMYMHKEAHLFYQFMTGLPGVPWT